MSSKRRAAPGRHGAWSGLWLLVTLSLAGLGAGSPGAYGEGSGDLLREARALEEGGRHMDAAEAFDRAVAEGAAGVEREEALLGAGRSWQSAGRVGEARARFEVLLRDSPRSRCLCEALWFVGSGWLEENRQSEALQAFRALADEHPHCDFLDRALLAMGDIYRSLHRARAAAETYRRVAELLPPSPVLGDALLREGLCLEEMGWFKEAADRYARLRQLLPNHALAARAELQRAVLLGRTGDGAEAEAVMRRTLSSGDPLLRGDALCALAMLKIRQGDRPEAARALATFGRENSLDARAPEALARASRLWSQAGEPRESAAVLGVLLDRYPDAPQNASWRLELGRATAAAGDADGALQAFLAAEEVARDPAVAAEAALERARILVDGGRAWEARQLLEDRVIPTADPDRASRAVILAADLCRHVLADPLRGAAIQQAFLDRCPAHASAPRVQAGRADDLDEAGLASEAVEACRAILQDWPESEEASWAEKRVREIEAIRPRLTGAGVDSLVALLEEAGRGERVMETDPRMLLRLADRLSRDLGNDEAAARYYGEYLERVPVDGETPRVLLARGFCRQRQALREEKGGEAGAARALRFGARSDFTRVTSEFPSSPWAPEAWLAAAEDSVATYEGDPEAKDLLELDLLESFLRRYPGDPGAERALWLLARAHARLAAGNPAHWGQVVTTTGTLLATFPETSVKGSARLWRARAYLEQAQPERALAQLEEILERSPSGPRAMEAQWTSAEAYRKIGRSKDAAEAYRTLLARFPGNPHEREAELRWGETLEDVGKDEEAIPILQRVVERGDALRDEAELALARALARSGKPAEALNMLESLAAEARGTALADEALFLEAHVLEEAGADEDASQVYDRLLAGNPRPELRARVLLSMADGLFAAGRYAPASERYLEILAQPPSSADRALVRRRLVAALYRQGQGPRADEALAAFSREFPQALRDEAELQLEKAQYHLEKGEFAEALSCLARVREGAPGLDLVARTDYLLGEAYLKQQEFDRAQVLFRRVLDEEPDGDLAAQAAFRLGQAAVAIGDAKAAAAAFATASEKAGTTPLGAQALYERAGALEKSGALAQAREAFEQFAARFPEQAQMMEAIFRGGRCSQGLGEFTAAATTYERILPFADRRLGPEIQYSLGECYAELGRSAEARAAFEQVISRSGEESDWGKRAAEKLAALPGRG